MVGRSPPCTVPSACGTMSCGEPRRVFGICGLRAVGVTLLGGSEVSAPHGGRENAHGDEDDAHPYRQKTLPAPALLRAVMTKATLLGQMGRKRTTIPSGP
jgi:hypothetical protein